MKDKAPALSRGFVVCGGGLGLAVAGTVRLHRLLGPLLRSDAEYLVRELLLLVRHRVVQVLKGGEELLQMLRMLLGDLLVGLHVLQRVHRPEVVDTLSPGLVHVAGVLTHHLRELIPLRMFGGGDAQLSVQLFDPLLHPFFRVFTGHGVSGQRRGLRDRSFRHSSRWSARGLGQSGRGKAEKCGHSHGGKTV